ncbi:hypothetical protein ACVWW6_008870 [Bradyrhizobium sp. USDA 3311]
MADRVHVLFIKGTLLADQLGLSLLRLGKPGIVGSKF